MANNVRAAMVDELRGWATTQPEVEPFMTTTVIENRNDLMHP